MRSKYADVDDEDRCSVCSKTLDFTVDPPILHDECGHYACAASCSDGSGDTCKRCATQAALPPPVSSGPAPLVVHPSQPRRGLLTGLLAKANSISAPMRNRHDTPLTSKDPYWLVSLGPTKVPVTLLIQKGLDFNTCVAHGLTMQHFLDGGYTIGHLSEFPEVTPQLSQDGIMPLGVQALQALQTTATHFKAYPVALPMERVTQETGLTPKHLVENFWIGFHPINGIMSLTGSSTPPDTAWSVDDLYRLGFTTMESFIGTLGLRKLSHWYALRPTKIDVELLGTTPEHLNLLEHDIVTPSPISRPVYDSPFASIAPGPRIGSPCVLQVSESGAFVKIPITDKTSPLSSSSAPKKTYSSAGVIQYSFGT